MRGTAMPNLQEITQEIAQEIWQRYAIEIGRALPDGIADKLAETVITTLRAQGLLT